MDFRGGWVLGARAAGATGRILADRFEEGLGRALPRTPEQLARPDVINELIRAHAPAGATPLPPVHAVRLPYRAFSFQTLMVAVTSTGLGSLTERDATLRTVLRRSVAAIERLRFGDWLDGL